MTRSTRVVLRGVALGAIIGAVVLMLLYRFAHPALTETQLFLQLWRPFLVAVFGTLLFSATLRRTHG